MSIHLVIGKSNGTDDAAVMFDSVTGWAFGPVFRCADDAEHFINYARYATSIEPHCLSDTLLRVMHAKWLKLRDERSMDGPVAR